MIQVVRNSPRQAIESAYQDRPEAHPFSYYELWHHRNGVVVDTPEFFVMGFPCHVASLAAEVDTNNRMHLAVSREDGPSCWYVSAMAGDMGKAWSAMPYRLPWIAFDRDDPDGPSGKRLQIMPMASVLRLTTTSPPQEETHHDIPFR